MFLNPKYKFKYLSLSQREIVKQIVESETESNRVENQREMDVDDVDIWDCGMEIDEVDCQEQQLNSNLSEIEKYLKTEFFDKKADLKKIMSFWESQKERLPVLYKLSKKYLSLLASSSTSERLFSMSSNFFTKHRTNTKATTLEKECVLKHFIDIHGTKDFY